MANQLDLEEQEQLFQDLMEQLLQTEYGRIHGIEKGITYQTFSNKLPLASFEDFLPYIQRMQAGEQQLLWPGDIKWLDRRAHV